MDAITDNLLFSKISKGDKNAFDVLFRKYYTQLVRFSMGYLHDGPASEEIVQDVFVRIWENAPRIEIETSVLAYLYRSVRNQALNQIKHGHVKQKFGQQQMANPDTTADDFEEKVNVAFFRKLLALAVGSLPEKCREIFEMSKFEGLTYDEIAEYLQVSVKTVENQMGIALRKLREAMLPYEKHVYET
ncbi:MAG: RNA polymerase sigma-70 factor [Bacteroidales bacterium]|nr:RNA polymerase sigma-70 factor [Bacteroidales bacterium]